MTQMIELIGKDIRTVIVTVFCILKKGGERIEHIK